MSILDDIDSLVSGITSHPGAEMLLSALPLAAGTFMASRPFPSRIGTPLGTLLAGLGSFGLSQGMEDEKGAQQAARLKQLQGILSQAAPEIGPPEPQGRLTTQLAGVPGLTPTDISAYERGFPAYSTPKTETILPVWNGKQWIDSRTKQPLGGEPASIRAAELKGASPTKPGSPESLLEQQWLAAHPGDYAGAANYALKTAAKYRPAPLPLMQVVPTPSGGMAVATVPRSRSGVSGAPTLTPLPGVAPTKPLTSAQKIVEQKNALALATQEYENATSAFQKGADSLYGSKAKAIAAYQARILAGAPTDSRAATYKGTPGFISADGKTFYPAGS